MTLTPEEILQESLRTHPCYNEKAHHEFARMHLPVAPGCNIQCNYCNRKFDCCNESRPGVTSEVLTPREAADKVAYVKERIPGLSVIGIAGPGDPLANKATFETLELIGSRFPDLTLCLSTNGLMLPGNEQRLFDLGVRFVTVTMNAEDPDIGADIYEYVTLDGKRYTGREGARILIERQKEGIERCAELGMLVKVNIVMVPGINDLHIPDLVRSVRSLGAYIVNILPLIPVEGTAFENRRAPTSKERKELMDTCSVDAKMMRHCKQCRADAIGLLGNDRSAEFAHIGACKDRCGSPGDLIANVDPPTGGNLVAVATTDGEKVDSGFGNSPRFDIYRVDRDGTAFVRTVAVDLGSEVRGKEHRAHIGRIIDELGDCDTVIVREIGSLPSSLLKTIDKTVVISDGGVREALESLSCPPVHSLYKQ